MFLLISALPDATHEELQLYKILYENYYKKVFSTAFYLLRDQHAAEDIVHDAFLQAFKKIDQLKDPKKFGPWICTIAVNLTKTYIKKENRHLYADESIVEIIDFQSNDFDTDLCDLIIEKELYTEVDEAIHTLPLPYKQILYLRYHLDLEYKEICTVLDLNINTVKTRLYRARQKLKNILQNNTQTEDRGTVNG
ncbi:RNA polymerase sigma factor [Clostridiaceae bacterium 35-E11]